MIENRVTPIFETTIRFFSFFTILTNLLVAIYFSLSLIKTRQGYMSIINKPGTLTAVTVYITIVGLVYQVILRHTWEPQGAQKIVDELLHSVIPVLVIIFWYLFEEKKSVTYQQIPKWLIYPLIYLIYILIRGRFSNFYPYPFVDAGRLGLSKVLANSAGLIVLFICISALYIKIGKFILKIK
ncbi:Pr6Pr family membrane protein [Dyadobacter sp. 3J3]|uniref:Pr6Pr family membrane protein n=1 Tax=Dyadobacter sp. 3J3 TaxID=2606600 RepID=UPI001E33AA00|nr:Pr6Pr family membrane protein [Dyadobacter sp. 3J3]